MPVKLHRSQPTWSPVRVRPGPRWPGSSVVEQERFTKTLSPTPFIVNAAKTTVVRTSAGNQSRRAKCPWRNQTRSKNVFALLVTMNLFNLTAPPTIAPLPRCAQSTNPPSVRFFSKAPSSTCCRSESRQSPERLSQAQHALGNPRPSSRAPPPPSALSHIHESVASFAPRSAT